MVTRRTRYRPHAIRGPALSRLCIRRLLRACCRTAARDACGSASLCRLSWQVMAAETVVSTGRGATQSGPVLCRGTACTAALLLTAESGLRVGLGPCVPGARGRLHCVCGRGQCSRVCKVLVAAEAGSVRKDGGTALVPAAGLTRRLPVCCQHTDGHCSEGLSAQKHRSASLVKEKPASREAPLQCISRHPRSAALVEMLCPYEKELQLADGRTAHVIAAALDSPALHAVFEEPKKKRARSRVGEHQGQVAADLRGMHAPVRGADSSHCPRPGAASDTGGAQHASRAPGSAVTICGPRAQHSALETFTT